MPRPFRKTLLGGFDETAGDSPRDIGEAAENCQRPSHVEPPHDPEKGVARVGVPDHPEGQRSPDDSKGYQRSGVSAAYAHFRKATEGTCLFNVWVSGRPQWRPDC